MARPTIIIANRKMNADSETLGAWKAALADIDSVDNRIIIAALPFPYLHKQYLPPNVALAAQDCHGESQGAFTGDVSPAMLKDLQVPYVIVGHSERRQTHGESDAAVRKKASAAQAFGITPILCVGEDLATREGGAAEEFVLGQLRRSLPDNMPGDIIIAYEPIWAIGSGKHASPEEAQAMHAVLRRELGDTCPLLYGGSVSPDNAANYLRQADIDGVLVGSASLDPDSFKAIIESAAL